MAGDVAKKINDTNVGHEGAAIIAPNGLKILPAFASRQRLDPQIHTPIDTDALSGVYDIRFDNPTYYG